VPSVSAGNRSIVPLATWPESCTTPDTPQPTMQTTTPEWQHLALYAICAALLIMLLQRLPYVGRIIRFAFSLGLLAFLIFVVLSQAPYQPELARLTEKLGLDDQQVAGKELKVKMAADGHFWVAATINGVPRRMLIDSGATVTALSPSTVRDAKVDTGVGIAPVVLRTANGAAPAETGKIDELKVGNIVARNLRIVTSPGLGGLDVLGMNFLSKLESWRVEGRTLVLVPHHPQNARG
jgi:aspartyl protease family protein